MSKKKKQIIEIFGMKLQIVTDDGTRAEGCTVCALQKICEALRAKPFNLPCSTSTFDSDRHFIKIE